jgi:formyltetrahydrofolate deformylase
MEKTAVLLISCPDRRGIVATVAEFLYKNNANIIHADEHQDSELNLFFLRVEWDMKDFSLDEKSFKKAFAPIAKEFNMKIKIAYSGYLPKAAIFVSREDHCLADLLYRHNSGELKCEIQLVISNHPNAKKIVEFYKIPFFEIPVMQENKEAAEKEEFDLLKKHKIDFIVLARYMRILSPMFVKAYPNTIINIHHSFLPAFIGANPYQKAYNRGVKIIGATSHYVTKTLDEGPIIEQDVIRVSHRDTIEDLIQKGRDLEKIVLSRAVLWHIENKILVFANKTVVFN